MKNSSWKLVSVYLAFIVADIYAFYFYALKSDFIPWGDGTRDGLYFLAFLYMLLPAMVLLSLFKMFLLKQSMIRYSFFAYTLLVAIPAMISIDQSGLLLGMVACSIVLLATVIELVKGISSRDNRSETTAKKVMMQAIFFYKVDAPYGFFSNFSPHPIFIDLVMWKTVEHYFQAMKFDDPELSRKISATDTPMKAANEGRNKKYPLRQDWEAIKETVMYNALLCKFLQHTRLKKEIILTGDLPLVEHTSNDNYWGDGGDGSGQNRLGILLMQVRKTIGAYSDDPDLVFPPWIAFPAVASEDMFWRMGLGEDYMTQWAQFYLQLDNKTAYQTMFPEVEGWEDAYEW